MGPSSFSARNGIGRENECKKLVATEFFATLRAERKSHLGMTRKSLSAVGAEIHQTKPFATLEEELLVSLLRTTDVLRERFEEACREFNLSMTQYNVLRILRGAEPKGRTCGEIGERMIAREPDVTRLLMRMEKAGLIRRTRNGQDRRVVMTRITGAGLKLLDEMEPHLRQIGGLLRPIGERKIEKTLRLLDAVREHVRQDEEKAAA